MNFGVSEQLAQQAAAARGSGKPRKKVHKHHSIAVEGIRPDALPGRAGNGSDDRIEEGNEDDADGAAGGGAAAGVGSAEDDSADETEEKKKKKKKHARKGSVDRRARSMVVQTTAAFGGAAAAAAGGAAGATSPGSGSHHKKHSGSRRGSRVDPPELSKEAVQFQLSERDRKADAFSFVRSKSHTTLGFIKNCLLWKFVLRPNMAARAMGVPFAMPVVTDAGAGASQFRRRS
jgi:hypothetical protein